jgi:hypothetical protein
MLYKIKSLLNTPRISKKKKQKNKKQKTKNKQKTKKIEVLDVQNNITTIYCAL